MTSVYGTLPTPSLQKAGKINRPHGVFRFSNSLVRVPDDEAWAVEHFGKFKRTIHRGYACLGIDCCGLCIGLQSMVLQAQPHECLVETKTQDHVFILLQLMLSVCTVRAESAFYGLVDVSKHLDACVSSEVRKQVSTMKLEQVFLRRELICEAVMRNVDPAMRNHGFTIASVLVTQVEPSAAVLESLHEILRQQALRAAALKEVQESHDDNEATGDDPEVAVEASGRLVVDECPDMSRILHLLRVVQHLHSESTKLKKASLPLAVDSPEDAPEGSARMPLLIASTSEGAPEQTKM